MQIRTYVYIFHLVLLLNKAAATRKENLHSIAGKIR